MNLFTQLGKSLGASKHPYRTVRVSAAATMVPYRSTIAASILTAASRQVVAIDDDFEHAPQTGLSLVPAGTEPRP